MRRNRQAGRVRSRPSARGRLHIEPLEHRALLAADVCMLVLAAPDPSFEGYEVSAEPEVAAPEPTIIDDSCLFVDDPTLFVDDSTLFIDDPCPVVGDPVWVIDDPCPVFDVRYQLVQSDSEWAVSFDGLNADGAVVNVSVIASSNEPSVLALLARNAESGDEEGSWDNASWDDVSTTGGQPVPRASNSGIAPDSRASAFASMAAMSGQFSGSGADRPGDAEAEAGVAGRRRRTR